MNGLPIATNKEKKKPYFKERSMGLGCFFVLFAAFPPLMVYAQYHNEPWIGTVLLGLLILLILYIVVFTVVFTKLMKRRKKP